MYTLFFIISSQKHRLWVHVRTVPASEAVLTSTHNLCFEQKCENIRFFLSENFQFFVVKFSIYLKRLVFVMRFFDVLHTQSPLVNMFEISKTKILPGQNSELGFHLFTLYNYHSVTVASVFIIYIRAATSENVPSEMCAQRVYSSACAFAQYYQNLPLAYLESEGCKVSLYGQRRL